MSVSAADAAHRRGLAPPPALVPELGVGDELISNLDDGHLLTASEQVTLLGALRRVQEQELDPVACQRALVLSALGALAGDMGWLSLADSADSAFRVVHTVGADELLDVRQQSVSGIGAQAARQQATLIVNDFEQSTRTPEASKEQLMRAGVRSLICTPLVAGELIGLLCVARRGTRPFQRRDSAVIGALAAQGAMTIRNGAMYAEASARTRQLREALSVGTRVHERLSAGEGLVAAAAVLASALGRAVMIQQSVIAEEPTWCAPDGRPLDSAPIDDPFEAVLEAAGERLGTLVIAGGARLGALQAQAIDVARTAIASELIARRKTEEAEWRLHGELLHELLSAPGPLARQLAIRARRHGVDLEEPATVMVASLVRPADGVPSLLGARSALRARMRPGTAVLAVHRRGSVVLALPAALASDRALIGSLARAVGGAGRVHAGVGRAASHHDALRQAEACRSLAADPDRPDLVDVEDLGLVGAVLEDAAGRRAAEFVQRELGALLDADRRTRVPLLDTLEALCATEGRVQAAARRCHVHETSMRHRLDRLEAVIDLRGGPERLLELRVAVEALQLLQAAGRDPFDGATPHTA